MAVTAAQVASDRLEAERLVAEIVQRLPPAVAELAAVRRVALEELRRAEQSRKQRLDAVRSQADARRQEARVVADQWAMEAATSAMSLIRDSAAAMAPGAASEDWALWNSWVPSAVPPRHLRFGDLPQQVGAAPAVAPFLCCRGWAIAADGAASAPAADFVQATLLRLLALLPLKRLRIVTYDPKTSGALGILVPVRAAHAASFPPLIIDPDALRAQLRECQAAASRNAEVASAHGARDLFDLWEQQGIPEGEVTVIVVLDYPTGINQETNALLAGLAETGASRGVHLLLQHHPDARPSEDVDPEAVLRHLERFTLAGETIRTTLFPPAVSVRREALPESSSRRELIQQAIRAAASDTGPTVLLRDLLMADLARPWTQSAVDGLDLPIGLRGRDPAVLSFRTANPPTAHLLLGGKTGYGKSNVLLDIIYSAAVRYGPDELELLLLDFKQGLEFQAFAADQDGRNWLPHATVLALESSQSFGLAVLRHAVAELGRRSELFKSAGGKVVSIGEYRIATGQPLPRVLLVIDEFQVLFDGDDEDTDEAVRLLETIARQGRVYGIHLLLASQSVSGISGFRTKGEAIFGQFLLRASLFNDPAESQAIFTMHNTAAADLTYRGEMILNRNGGTDPDRYNERMLAAFAEPGFTVELQETLWRLGHGRPPMVFLGREFAQWPDTGDIDALCAERPARALRLLTGRPIAITDRPAAIDLCDDIDQAVAVVGAGDDLFEATISSLVATAARNRIAGLKLVVLDGVGIEEGAGWVRPLIQDARSCGLAVEVVPRREVASYLLESVRPALAADAPADASELYLGLGLQRIADLTRAVPIDPDNMFDTISAADVLGDLARNGAVGGRYLIASWNNLRAAKEQLGHSLAGVGVLIALRLGSEDLREIAGFNARIDGHPRTLVIDRRSDTAPQVVVPFAANGWRR